MTKTDMNYQSFFPKELEIVQIEENIGGVEIRLKSKSNSCACPRCGSIISKRRATYERKAQDLSILGKPVLLKIKIYEYHCGTCNRPVAESFEGFLLPGSRLTERCKEFIVQLALSTSCEGASRILQQIGIRYSGDSIIRLLLNRLKTMPEIEAGDVIGVDDFAYKKRHTYGTVIVDGGTHRPIALLDGRDGKALREWLQHNKHVKVVTRDRASEYAKVLQEELPDAIQVADRFHLYENLLQAIKKALNAGLPATVAAEAVENSTSEEEGKKRVCSSANA